MLARGIVPLDSPRSDADLRRALSTVEAALRGTGPAVAPLPADAAAVTSDWSSGDHLSEVDGHIAAAVATSGSTGDAKVALLTAAALHASAAATAERLGGPGQWVLALSTEHIAGLQVLVRSVLAGTTPRLVPPGGSFTAGAFAAATAALGGSRRYAALVPTQLRRLLDEPDGVRALATFDAILVGGAALEPSLRDSAVALGARIVVTYGMTETCGGCVYDGEPLRDVVVRAPTDEPLWLGGPVVFSGYLGRPDLTVEALVVESGVRWHVTNDLGLVNAESRLVVIGRADDVIVTGGEKVAPTMVEAALAMCDGVRAVLVVGLPDSEWGERVVAVVVPVDPSAPPSLESLRAAARTTLAPYALPRELRLVDALPLLPSGKPDRRAFA